MTSIQMSELHKLSVKDKMEVVQTLWDDIAEEQAIFKAWSEVQQKFDEK